MTSSNPYSEHVIAVRQAFSDLKGTNPPPGIFVGKNFMADEVFGFFRGDGVWIEVSWGRFFDHYTMGVTLRWDDDRPNECHTYETPELAAAAVAELGVKALV